MGQSADLSGSMRCGALARLTGLDLTLLLLRSVLQQITALVHVAETLGQLATFVLTFYVGQSYSRYGTCSPVARPFVPVISSVRLQIHRFLLGVPWNPGCDQQRGFNRRE